MATITGLTEAGTLAIVGGSVVSASFDSSNHLILTLQNGSTVDAGAVTVANASDTVAGKVELATDTETITGTDTTRAVTPFGLAALTSSETRRGLVELATSTEALTGTDTARAVTPAGVKAVGDTKQPLDADLTAIAALAKTNDNVLQVKSGAWTERTMAQLATDLSATGEWPNIQMYSGGAYADVDSVHIYIGTVDPGSVANGSIWFDTNP